MQKNDETRQKRRRRRAINRDLRNYVDDYDGYDVKALTKSKVKPPSEDDEIERRWRYLMKHTSKGTRPQLQRAYDQYKASETASKKHQQKENENVGSTSGRKQRTTRAWSFRYSDPYSSTPWSSFYGDNFESYYWQGDYYSSYFSNNNTRNPSGILSADVKSSLTVLGLNTDSLPSADALKRAFHSCAMVHHPDRHATNASAAALAEGKFKEVQIAFDYLRPMCSQV